jgi:hypothetical protein
LARVFPESVAIEFFSEGKITTNGKWFMLEKAIWRVADLRDRGFNR